MAAKEKDTKQQITGDAGVIGSQQLCDIQGYSSTIKYVIDMKCPNAEMSLPDWIAKLKELKIINNK